MSHGTSSISARGIKLSSVSYHRTQAIYFNRSMSVCLVLISTGITSGYTMLQSVAIRKLPRMISSVHLHRSKPSTVRLGFRLTGLWPINPALVVDELVDLNSPSPPSSAAPGSSSARDSDISTPKTIARVKKLEERLEDKIARMESPSSTRRLIHKLAKAATEFSYLTSELQSNLERTEYLREIRYARERQKSRKSAKLYGIVHSSQLKRIEWIKKRGDDLRALTKLRPYWKREVMLELKRYCKAKGYFIKG